MSEVMNVGVMNVGQSMFSPPLKDSLLAPLNCLDSYFPDFFAIFSADDNLAKFPPSRGLPVHALAQRSSGEVLFINFSSALFSRISTFQMRTRISFNLGLCDENENGD